MVANTRQVGVSTDKQIDLLRVVAMELQQPLTHISGLASMLREGVFKAEELPAQFAQLEISSQRMQRLIESLLFAGQLQNQQLTLEMEPINPASVVHDIATELRPMALNYHRSLNLSITQELQPVATNREALNYGLYNLLDVVIRSSRSEVIDVLVHHQLDEVMVTIRDDSDRLPANVLKTILTRLGSSSQPIKQIPGSAGLGLYVASVLTDFMGGDLQMQTSHGKRVVSLSLPLSKQTSLAV